MSYYIKAELVQKILHQYLDKFNDEKDEGKKILKNLANANADVVVGCLLDYLNSLEIDPKYLEQLTLLSYIVQHISAASFALLKDKLHEFIIKSVEITISLNRSPVIVPKDMMSIYQQREKLIQSLVSAILKFSDEETVKLIQNLFFPGKVPDSSTLLLIKILIEEKGISVLDYSNEMLTKFLSTCTLVENPKIRELYASIMAQIYQQLSTCVENASETVELRSVYDVTISIYSIISQDWVSSTDSDCQLATMNLVGSMIQFFPANQIQRIAERIVTSFITLLKKSTPSNARISLCIAFTKVLETLLKSNKPYFEHMIKSIQVQLYDLYKLPIFSSNFEFSPEVQRNKSALLGILQNLAEFNADNILDLYISRHSSKDMIEKIASLWITNFLVNRNYDRLSIPMKKMLLTSLQSLVFEPNYEVRFVIVEVIFSLWNQNSFYEDMSSLSIDASFMLYFLIQQVSIHPQEIADKRDVRFPPFQTTLDILKTRSQYVLQIITTNSIETGTHNLLWPWILQYIPNPSFSPGLGSILKTIHTFVAKYTSFTGKIPQIISEENSIIPKIGTILSRMIILLRIPQFFKGLGSEILKAIPHILTTFLQKECSKEIVSTIQDLEFTLKQDLGDEVKWSDKIYQLWKQILDQFQSKEWFTTLHEDLNTMGVNYKRIPELHLHMMKLHGLVLSKIENIEIIKQQIDRFVTDVHNDYSNHTVNLNIERELASLPMRLCLADTLALISTEKLEIVIDKIRNILNSSVTQKKQQSGFASGLLGMLKKNQPDEEVLVPLTSNMIIALGYICNRLSSKQISIKSQSNYLLKLSKRKLATKIESHIINNILPFLDRNGDEMQSSVQRAVEMVSRGALRIQDDCEKEDIIEFKKILVKYKEKFYQRAVITFKTTDIASVRSAAWETATHLLKLDPPYSFQQHLSFFNSCLIFINDNLEHIDQFEHSMTILFEAMLHHSNLLSDPTFLVVSVPLQKSNNENEEHDEEISEESKRMKLSYGNDNSEVSLWEIITVLAKTIEQHTDLTVLTFFYSCLLKSMFNKKLSPPEQADTKYLTVILVILLSHIYKSHQELQKVSLFTLEKILIGMGIYLNVNMKDIDSFNDGLIRQLAQKLNYDELQCLVNESVSRVIKDENIEVLSGFLSLHNKFYTLHEEKLSEQLEPVLKSYTAVFEVSEKLESGDKQKDQVIGYVMSILENNLTDGLNLLLSEKLAFPLSGFHQRIFTKIVENKSTLFKTFNYLTDVLNNPEDKLFKCKGDAMTNAIFFIGFMFSLNKEILNSITKKYFPSIFGTFILRFSTSLDYDFNKGTVYKGEGMDSSKICLWAFHQMLQNSVKSHYLNDISTGLQQKFLREDDLQNGISELLMIIAKKINLDEIQEIMNFMKPFLLKKMKGQRRVSQMVVSQLIHSSSFVEDFKDQRQQNNLSEWYNYLIDELLLRINDNDEEMRSITFRGIGNISFLHKFNIIGCEEENQPMKKNDNLDQEQLKEGKSSEGMLLNEMDEGEPAKKQLLDENMAENLQEIIQKEEESRKSNQKLQQQPCFILSNTRYAKIIEALLQGMDDSSDSCVKDALISLQSLIPFLNGSLIKPYVILLLQKVTESFEKQNVQIRVSSFNLFGQLLEKIDVNDELQKYIDMQLHYVIVSIVVHLLDSSKQVQDVCKQNMNKIASILNIQELRQFLIEEVVNEEFSVDFLEKREQVALQIMQLILSAFPEKSIIYLETLIEYTKSPDDRIQCSACLQMFLTLRGWKDADLKRDHREISELVMQRLHEILDNSHSSRISDLDRYMLKSTVFFIKQNSNIE